MPFSNWHPFTKPETEKAPACKGVYQICDAKGEVVYIGSSESNIRSRLIAHKAKAKFIRAKGFRYMRVGEDRLWTTARHIERSLCKKFYKEHGKLPRFQERSPKNIDILDWLN
jgi:hypothetical protein